MLSSLKYSVASTMPKPLCNYCVMFAVHKSSIVCICIKNTLSLEATTAAYTVGVVKRIVTEKQLH